MWEGIGAGAAVALGNGLAAWLAIRWAYAQHPRLFTAVILGGMVLRIAAVTLASVALLELTALRPGPYMIGLGAAVLAVQVGEIVLLVRKAGRDRPPDGGLPASTGDDAVDIPSADV